MNLNRWCNIRIAGDTHKAYRMVMGGNIAPARVRAETGMSLARILERLKDESIAENARQTGCCPATIRKYREQWI